MQKVLTAAQMREVDRLTTERYGITSILLMENAAHAVARVITEKLGGSVKGKSILILCGKGNNGGDGAALARILWTLGANVDAQLFGRMADTEGDARTNFEILSKMSNQVFDPSVWFEEFPIEDHLEAVNFWTHKKAAEIDLVVDALFGTGLNRVVESGLRAVILATQQMVLDPADERDAHPIFVSIDLPSGLLADSSYPPTFARFEGDETQVSIAAQVTVTFSALKLANIIPPASNLNGEVIVANIGSPQEIINRKPSQLFLSELDDAKRWLSSTGFLKSSFKNKRGHALIVAGSETFSGAAVLAGNSAIRSGVGLVTLACPTEAKTEIASRMLPEVILATLGSSEFDELKPKANAIAIGPGLSATDPEIETLVRKIVEERTTPVIVDAGALWFLNPPAGLLQKPDREGGRNNQAGSNTLADAQASAPLILTPHEGEFMRLLGTDDKEAINDRVAAVREFATNNNVILVLKGERVLIGHPDGRVVVNPTGNSGLGKAGNGDTLTGVLAGFCAQAAAMDIAIFETVVAAVYIAGLAGDIAEKKYGKRVMTASDVRECLTEAFAQCEAS